MQMQLIRDRAGEIYNKLGCLTVKCHAGRKQTGFSWLWSDTIHLYGTYLQSADVTSMVFHETTHAVGKFGHNDPDDPNKWAAWATGHGGGFPPPNFDEDPW